MPMNRLVVCFTLLSLVPVGATAQTPPKPPPQKPAAPANPNPATSQKAAQAAALDLSIQKWTGDLDGMIKRRRIRVITTYNKMNYLLDKGQPRGIVPEVFKAFEDELNKKLKTGNLRVHVIIVPASRDELQQWLAEGRGDVVAAGVAITPERQKLFDFTTPTFTGIDDIVVTGPRSPKIATVDDLAGQEVYVRPATVYHQSLVRLNEDFKKRGKPQIVLKAAPDSLEDEDLLEMLNAGLVKATVVHTYVATFWREIFPNLTLNEGAVVSKEGQIGMVMRKNSPKLKAALDEFIKTHGRGTAFGNILTQRYLKSAKYVKSATNPADLKRFEQIVKLFRKYGDQYKLDFLLMAAQGYQESTLDQSAKSHVGAVGVMQVMPATGKELGVGDIRQLEPNIHAGVKYVRFMMDKYYADEPMDQLNKGLFTFASYNAGPGRVRQLRREAEKRGLNPNVWFNNVERIASERIGRETVTYVSNIYKYYLAYKLVMEDLERREKSKEKG
jgi:membrane-bound lytic murein transglycosylase MltF